MHSPEFELNPDAKEGNKEMADLEPDFTQITASDLRRVLRGEETKAENELTVFKVKENEGNPDTFGFWGYRMPGDTKLNKIYFSPQAQEYFQKLLKPEEDRWDKDLKTPTGLPMTREDKDAAYRGRYQ